MLWRNKRSKKKRKKNLFAYSVVFGIFFIILVLVGLLGVSRLKKTLFVSPVPKKHVIARFVEKKVEEKKADVETLLRSAHIPFSTVEASGSSSFVVLLENGANVLLSKDKNLLHQVSSLQGILSRLTMEGKTFALLDLRFSKPVIRMR